MGKGGVGTGFQVLLVVDSVGQVPGFDPVIAFVPSLNRHLSLFEATLQFFDLFVELEVPFIAFRIEGTGFDRFADGATGV
jgi:hypothetical protein